jgi:8-oxo-dGTP pyrophosphatase MutT (NUDIX family)
MTLKPWKRVTSSRDRSFPIFTLRTDRVRSPRTNQDYDFYILESADWVNIIPITPKREVILIRQYRHGIQDMALEIPGGIIEPDDSPREAALRELAEETGYTASQISALDYVWPNPAFLDNRCYTFLARDTALTGDQTPDEKEDIEVIPVPLERIPDMIRRGDIRHSLVVAAFYKFQLAYGLDAFER